MHGSYHAPDCSAGCGLVLDIPSMNTTVQSEPSDVQHFYYHSDTTLVSFWVYILTHVISLFLRCGSLLYQIRIVLDRALCRQHHETPSALISMRKVCIVFMKILYSKITNA